MLPGHRRARARGGILVENSYYAAARRRYVYAADGILKQVLDIVPLAGDIEIGVENAG